MKLATLRRVSTTTIYTAEITADQLRAAFDLPNNAELKVRDWDGSFVDLETRPIQVLYEVIEEHAE